MKIALAQLHMYTNIMYKFQSSTCKTVGEKLRTKLSTDRRTDSHGDSSIPPPLRCGGIIIKTGTKQAQADRVRLFQNDGLVRQNYHF